MSATRSARSLTDGRSRFVCVVKPNPTVSATVMCGNSA